MDDFEELSKNEEFQARLKEINDLGPEGLRRYIIVCRVLNFVVSTVGVLSILFVLYFPMLMVAIGCGIIVFQSARLSTYFTFLKDCLEELARKHR